MTRCHTDLGFSAPELRSLNSVEHPIEELLDDILHESWHRNLDFAWVPGRSRGKENDNSRDQGDLQQAKRSHSYDSRGATAQHKAVVTRTGATTVPFVPPGRHP